MLNTNNKIDLEKPNLYINSKKIDVGYNLNTVNDQLYNLQIITICKNPLSTTNNNINNEKTIKNYGIYKMKHIRKPIILIIMIMIILQF